jgi:hypothetical protein
LTKTPESLWSRSDVWAKSAALAVVMNLCVLLAKLVWRSMFYLTCCVEPERFINLKSNSPCLLSKKRHRAGPFKFFLLNIYIYLYQNLVPQTNLSLVRLHALHSCWSGLPFSGFSSDATAASFPYVLSRVVNGTDNFWIRIHIRFWGYDMRFFKSEGWHGYGYWSCGYLVDVVADMT